MELEYLQSWSLPLLSLLLCQTDRINYKFSGGDWVTGQPKPFIYIIYNYIYIYIYIYCAYYIYSIYIYIIRIYDWLYSELLGLCSGYDVSIPGTSHHSGFAQWHRVKRSRICPSSLEADTSDLWKKMGDFAHPKWLFAWGKWCRKWTWWLTMIDHDWPWLTIKIWVPSIKQIHMIASPKFQEISPCERHHNKSPHCFGLLPDS